jgi:hypothetical protein
VPDSLTALAILALVGLPGYVYIVLVPRKPSDGSRESDLHGALEVLLFGVTFAAVGVMLALFARPSLWADVLTAYTGAKRPLTADVVVTTVFAAFLAFVSAMFVAAFAASVIRVFAARRTSAPSPRVLMGVTGFFVAALMGAGVATYLQG